MWQMERCRILRWKQWMLLYSNKLVNCLTIIPLPKYHWFQSSISTIKAVHSWRRFSQFSTNCMVTNFITYMPGWKWHLITPKKCVSHRYIQNKNENQVGITVWVDGCRGSCRALCRGEWFHSRAHVPVHTPVLSCTRAFHSPSCCVHNPNNSHKTTKHLHYCT